MSDTEVALVVVGAGASHDAAAHGTNQAQVLHTPGLPDRVYRQVRPPLTNRLVAEEEFHNSIIGNWPWCRQVVNNVRQQLRVDQISPQAAVVTLEQALAKYETDESPESQRHLLAFRFYLRDLLWAATSYMMSSDLSGGVTNYVAMVSRLLKWTMSGAREVCIVSFNYDLLIERALESTWNFNPSQISSYLHYDRMKLLKPHGSIQWQWPVRNHDEMKMGDPYWYGKWSIENALRDGVDETQITMAQYGSHEWPYPPKQRGRGAIPAVALPIVSRKAFVWPEDQLDYLVSLQGRVSTFACIGWRAMEDHFLPMLRPLVRQTARAHVVTGGDRPEAEFEAQSIISRLAEYLDVPKDRFLAFHEGFGRYVQPAQGLDQLLGLKDSRGK